ncbi:hypothetical protein V6N13_083915 [Hibiscus sabdariffa]|uniref:Uncharacterized protein n=1 Tax=Hibiscus sabdariffa TaxID=183260 RepID=A0ABR2SZM7_9ROSI
MAMTVLLGDCLEQGAHKEDVGTTISNSFQENLFFQTRSKLLKQPLSQISGESLLFVSSSFNAFESTTNDAYLGWNKAPEIVNDGGGEAETLERTDKMITVILLGWLGGYDSRGIHAVNFLVELRDLLCLDPISILDRRIVELKNGLATWGSNKKEDDCERCFIFQTFSNTGWLGELIHPMLI